MVDAAFGRIWPSFIHSQSDKTHGLLTVGWGGWSRIRQPRPLHLAKLSPDFEIIIARDVIEKLRGGIDLVFVSSSREAGQFMDVIRKPRRSPGQEYAAIFEHRSVSMQAHNFVGAGRWSVFSDAIYEFGFQVLDKLGAGRLVLDQDRPGVIFIR